MKNGKNILYDKKRFLELWQKSKAGDKYAFRQLADAHYNTLFRYATNFTKDKEVIKDTIQELLIGLWEKRQTIEMEVVTIYLIKALRNRLLNNFRKIEYSGNHTGLTEATEIADEFQVDTHLISAELANEKEQKVHMAIDSLPKRQQEVVFLKYYHGMDNEKIAEIMGINKQSVANFLHKALGSLKIHLSNKVIVFMILALLYISSFNS